ncbi:MAG: putative 2OG-Fe(II) oxygenase [Gammaproteobacteria bacterium]|jgi:tetratricopeptide (TPR) repeat protein|nr:putative 2OG-Fe(II) oxygenase [Gammaproteobacteria bacterium]
MQDAQPETIREAEQQLGLAMDHHQAGRLAAADRHYARVLELVPVHSQALRLRGIVARTRGHLQQSLQLLSAAVEYAPTSARAHAELGLTRMASGDLQGAEHSLRTARMLTPNAINVLTNLGALLQHRGHVREAVDLYREVLAQDSDEFEVRCNLIKALADTGDIDTALREAEAAVAAAGGARGTLAAKGAVLVDARRYPAAAAVLRAAVAQDPADGMAQVNLALCYAELGELQPAIGCLQTALEHNPHNARAAADLVNALSRSGEDAAAVGLGEHFLAGHPGERMVTGSYALALHNAGETRRAAELTDCSTLVQVFDLAAPAPFASPDAFNAALRQLLLADGSLLNDPVGKATTGGAQTGELDLDSAPALRGFAQRVNAAVREALATYRSRGLATHPLMQVATPDWHLRAWGTVLQAGGRQSPHMHPLGWLSGVYYVDLPAGMDATDPQAGWLEFGAPPDRYYCPNPPATSGFAPAAGRLIVFPSWFWHRTLPFSSSASRISIAFDVMPSFADR